MLDLILLQKTLLQIFPKSVIEKMVPLYIFIGRVNTALKKSVHNSIVFTLLKVIECVIGIDKDELVVLQYSVLYFNSARSLRSSPIGFHIIRSNPLRQIKTI